MDSVSSIPIIGRGALDLLDEIVENEMARIWREQYKGSSPVSLKHDFFNALDKALKEIDASNFPLLQDQEEVKHFARELVHNTILKVLARK